MHMFIHTLSFISGGDSPEGPAKEYDGSWIDSAPVIFEKWPSLVPFL